MSNYNNVLLYTLYAYCGLQEYLSIFRNKNYTYVYKYISIREKTFIQYYFIFDI